MATSQVNNFIAKALEDEQLLGELGQVMNKSDREEQLKGIVSVAGAAGYWFTAEEYEQAIVDRIAEKRAAGEIEELDVTGQGCSWRA